MSELSVRFDPWGPISVVLYETRDSDFVEDAIATTGVDVDWRPFSRADAYSHSTRIRALRRDIQRAYQAMEPDQRGLFVQIIVKALLRRADGEELHRVLNERLADIGWMITEAGVLLTQDALVSEQFFQPNSEYDAYVAIRDILGRAQRSLLVVDGYVGASLLLTLKSLGVSPLSVRLLTSKQSVKHDFPAELGAFRKQFPQFHVKLRTSEVFHDRFVVVDDQDVFHIGASLKDAGRRAFMISRIENLEIAAKTRDAIEQAWAEANGVGDPAL
ncbi:hypothetical protein [Chelativorans alearense]|uniref:hypothetical protein n=1 Tax=Chelativorans alearense TaxID=2681495 RepID=UPI0013D40DBE|nr:hypothetical protein [Chelativorans alearense]